MMECEKENRRKLLTRAPNDNDTVPAKSATYGYGYRHLQAALLLINLAIAYSNRAHLSLTLVAMSTHIATKSHNVTDEVFDESDDIKIIMNTTVKEKLASLNANNLSKPIENNTVKHENDTAANTWDVYRTYDWAKPTQDMILNSFYLGYFLMMIPMGIVGQRFGGKIPLQISLLVNGVVTIATPFVAVWGGWKAVCFCRILQGLSQAGLFPITNAVLAKWVPVSERAMFSSYVFTGATVGTIIAFQIAGALASSEAGWPATFWVFGSVSLGTFILITMFVESTPTEHKSISKEEKTFILGKMDDGIRKRKNIPWRQILSSKHVWGTYVGHVASEISFVFLFTQIPSYMFYILGFNVKNSGIFSSLPYIASIFCSIIYGYISEYCTNNGICTLRTARIVSNSIAQVGPALCLLAVSFTENSTFAVILLILGVGLLSGVHTGWMKPAVRRRS